MRCSKIFIGEIQLFISTILFALSFVGQREATEDEAGPSTYNAWRYIISAILLLICKSPLQKLLDSDLGDTTPEDVPILVHIKSWLPQSLSEQAFDLFFWGTLCGLANFSLSTCQQYGLLTVTAGKAAFINGLFVVVTPFASLILPGSPGTISYMTWCSVALSIVGVYLLSDADSLLSIGKGEILLLGAMLGCVVSILAADAGSKRVDCVSLTCVEFVVTAALCTIVSLYTEWHLWAWPLHAFQNGYKMIVLVAVTEASAFLISSIGQMHSSASRAALILSLESVFTALLGYALLGEVLTNTELLGCALMFSATLISTSSALEEEEEIEEKEGLVIVNNSSDGIITSDSGVREFQLIDLSKLHIGSSNYQLSHHSERDTSRVTTYQQQSQQQQPLLSTTTNSAKPTWMLPISSSLSSSSTAHTQPFIAMKHRHVPVIPRKRSHSIDASHRSSQNYDNFSGDSDCANNGNSNSEEDKSNQHLIISCSAPAYYQSYIPNSA